MIDAPTMKRAADIREGDAVDLEGDQYADPKRNHPCFETEYAVVMETEQETPECVCIYFDGFACGFPTNHLLHVRAEP